MSENGNNNLNNNEMFGSDDYNKAGQNNNISGKNAYTYQNRQYPQNNQSAQSGTAYNSQSGRYVPGNGGAPVQNGGFAPQQNQYQYMPNSNMQYPAQGNKPGQYGQAPQNTAQNNPYGQQPGYPQGGNTPDGGDEDKEKKIIIILVAAILCIIVICCTIFGVKALIGGNETTTKRTVSDASDEYDDKTTTRRVRSDTETESYSETTTAEETESTTEADDDITDSSSGRYKAIIGSNVAEIYCNSSRVSVTDIDTFLEKIKDGVDEQNISFVLVLSDNNSYLNNTSSLLSNELSGTGLSTNSDAVILSIDLSSGSCAFNASGKAVYAVYDRRTEWYETEVSKLCNGYNYSNMSTMVDEFVAETENITEGIIPFTGSMTSCSDSYTCHTNTSGSTVNIRLVPGDTNSDITGQLKDTNKVRVYYIYTNSSGEKYGFIDIKGSDNKRASGWVPMEYLQ